MINGGDYDPLTYRDNQSQMVTGGPIQKMTGRLTPLVKTPIAAVKDNQAISLKLDNQLKKASNITADINNE